jgi:hypothetical protein
VFPHAAACPEHAELDRVARAERQSVADPRAATFESVGLAPIAAGLSQLQQQHDRPFEVSCHRSACGMRLAESIEITWRQVGGAG